MIRMIRITVGESPLQATQTAAPKLRCDHPDSSQNDSSFVLTKQLHLKMLQQIVLIIKIDSKTVLDFVPIIHTDLNTVPNFV